MVLIRVLVAFLYLLCITPFAYAENTRSTLFMGQDRYGTQLWQTDNTTAGTRLSQFLVNKPNGDSHLNFIETLNGIGIFSAYTPELGVKYYRTDGTPKGTYLIQASESNKPSPSLPLDLKKRALLWQEEANTLNLLLTDETVTTSSILKAFPTQPTQSPQLTVSSFYKQQYLSYFWVTRTESSIELWRTDGTSHGTYLLKHFKGPSYTSLIDFENHLDPQNELQGNIFFWVDDGQQGEELWQSDGTIQGTKLVVDATREIQSIKDGSIPNISFTTLTPHEHALYFSRPSISTNDLNAKSSIRLWKVTAQKAEVLYETPEITNTYNFHLLGLYDHQLIWVAPNEADNTLELWRLKPSTKTPEKIYAFPRENDLSFLEALYFHQGKFYFCFGVYQNRQEIWSTDFSTQGTQLLTTFKKIPHEYQAISPKMFAFAGRLYIFNLDIVRPEALWVTDGSPQGTHPLVTAPSAMYMGDAGGAWANTPEFYNVVNDKLVFITFASNDKSSKLWSLSAAQPEKAELLGEFADPILLKPLNNNASFLQFINGNERWQTDGTKKGTKRLSLNQSGISSIQQAFSNIPFVRADQQFGWLISYQSADTGTELGFISANTKDPELLKDINTAPASACPKRQCQVISVGQDTYWLNTDTNQLRFIENGKSQPILNFPHLNAEKVLTHVNDGHQLYLSIKNSYSDNTTTIWQINKQTATLLTTVRSERIFPSEQGFYLSEHSPMGTYRLQHWQDGTFKIIWEDKSTEAKQISNMLETKQGLLYTLKRPDQEPKSKDNAQLWWQAHRSTTPKLIKSYSELTDTQRFFQTQQAIYVIEWGMNQDSESAYKVHKLNLQHNHLEPLEQLPVSFNDPSEIVPNSHGFFFKTDGESDHDTLWYLEDTQSQPQIIKTTQGQNIQIVSSPTPREGIYFNLTQYKTRSYFGEPYLQEQTDISELWISEGSAKTTRLLKEKLQMIDALY